MNHRLNHRPEAYQAWMRIVIHNMAHLSKPQAVVLAMWSFGIAITQSCGVSTVSAFLAALLNHSENSVRQRLKEWYKGSQEKWGHKRAQVDVTGSFVPLVQWILSWWPPEQKRLVLAADASTLGNRFSLLVISLIYRGCGIPVAWKVLEANAKGSWQPHWLALLEHLHPAVPEDWWVILTTDRGLYAKWFYEAIQALHWHPFMRINHQGQYQPESTPGFVPLHGVVPQVGTAWSGRVSCFKTNPLQCTLLARWDDGYADPWLIVTDLDPNHAEILWYGMRSWIECVFKDIKRGGLHWHLTRMRDPQRVERLWLAIAVATLWLVSVGGHADAHLTACSLYAVDGSLYPMDDPSQSHAPQPPTRLTSAPILPSTPTPPQPRVLSCFRRGLLVILATLLKGDPLPIGGFIPECFAESTAVPIFSSG
ncbi:MAG: transposase [Moorea sp. SIO4G3]|nr:transposase [Moorena sp. SIO4G3]